MRAHLIENHTVSDLCDKHQLHPTLFYQWQRTFFENGADAFTPKRSQTQPLSKEQQKITALEAKLRTKTDVLAEIVEEPVRTKKSLGRVEEPLSLPTDTRDMVIDFIQRLAARTEIAPLRLVGWLELSPSKYYDWRDVFGKANEHNRQSAPRPLAGAAGEIGYITPNDKFSGKEKAIFAARDNKLLLAREQRKNKRLHTHPTP